MRLMRLALRGLTVFRDPVSIDLDALGPGLVAIAGPNGAGKSTLLEAACAALWKAIPSRPGWYEHWSGRDGFVEAVFDDRGHELKARVQVDAERRTTEAYLFADGESLTTGRAAEYEAEVGRRFGSLELFLASAFAAQTKTGNFLGLAKAERKALVIELLGLGHLQLLAEAARGRRGAAELDVARTRALVEASQQTGRTLAERRSAHAAALARVDELAPQLEAARTEESAAAAAVERARALVARREELQRAERGAAQRVVEGETSSEEALALAPAAERRAVARKAALAAERPEDGRTRARDRYGRELVALEDRRRRAEAAVSQADQVEAAIADVLVLEETEAWREEGQAAAAAARETATGAERKLLEARHRAESGLRALEAERFGLRKQAEPVDEAPCATAAEWRPAPGAVPQDPAPRDLAGTCRLLAGARDALERLRVLGLDPELERAVERAEATHARAQAALTEAEAQARPEVLADVRRRLVEARRLAAAAPAVESARGELDNLAGDRRRLDVALGEDLAAADQAEARITAELKAAGRELAAALEDARVRVRDAAVRLEAARQAHAEATAAAREVAGAGVPSDAVARAAADARSQREYFERELRAAEQQSGALRASAEEAERAAAAALEHEAAARAAELEVADWSLLERALGRDGCQALEVDAAGPEVARLTNELLAACYGTRFSIAFETLHERKRARGEFVEAFDVIVFDGPRDRPVEALSGGEKVIVGEAVGLAIAIFNARRSGVRWETLFRDETAGALDAVNASAYIDLLRRALALGGFRQVLFVAHQAEIVERADVVLRVAGGQLSLAAERRAA